MKKIKKTSKIIKILLENTNSITVEKKLEEFYGIKKTSKKILSLFGIPNHCKTKQLTEKQCLYIENYIKRYIKKNKFIVIKETKKYFSFLYEMNHYKSVRLSKGLPIHGQRTHSNAKTAKLFNKLWIKKN